MPKAQVSPEIADAANVREQGLRIELELLEKRVNQESALKEQYQEQLKEALGEMEMQAASAASATVGTMSTASSTAEFGLEEFDDVLPRAPPSFGDQAPFAALAQDSTSASDARVPAPATAPSALRSNLALRTSDSDAPMFGSANVRRRPPSVSFSHAEEIQISREQSIESIFSGIDEGEAEAESGSVAISSREPTPSFRDDDGNIGPEVLTTPPAPNFGTAPAPEDSSPPSPKHGFLSYVSKPAATAEPEIPVAAPAAAPEQVAATGEAQWAVQIDRSRGDLLGINLNNETLAIESVNENGLFGTWNIAHPTKAVCVGHRILVVNGQTTFDGIVQECKGSHMLNITMLGKALDEKVAELGEANARLQADAATLQPSVSKRREQPPSPEKRKSSTDVRQRATATPATRAVPRPVAGVAPRQTRESPARVAKSAGQAASGTGRKPGDPAFSKSAPLPRRALGSVDKKSNNNFLDSLRS